MNTQLNGHSGCGLLLMREDSGLYVKKTAKDEAYNTRLKNQCHKQKSYRSEIFAPVQILKEGYGADGLYYFTMEYINGVTMADIMEEIELTHLEEIGNLFLALIPPVVQPDPLAPSIFQNKIAQLRQGIGDKLGVAGQSLQDLTAYSWDYIATSPCHGDLTLENMIVSGGKIYLLDFLDSFYDSWLIDMAKLFQDIDTHWHYRKDAENNNLNIRLLILKQILVRNILQRPDGDKIMDSLYHVLLLNLLRIVPYTKDDLTMAWLERNMAYVRKQIKEKGWR